MVMSADKQEPVLPIAKIFHPHYHEFYDNWLKYRLTYEGGARFILTYLERYSEREEMVDFKRRKKYTYCPAFAKAAINDIKNSIYSRMAEVRRIGGSPVYKESVEGFNGGVDLNGASMNTFLGQKVLPELLTMSKVAVFVDKGRLNGPTMIENVNNRPYLYYYGAEEIRSWSYGPNFNLASILLVDHCDTYDDATGLPTGIIDRLRWVWIGKDQKVHIKFYNMRGYPIDYDMQLVDQEWEVVVDLPFIPVVLGEISQSLLKDIADYQIALLNLASSNLHYAMQSNFPFYTEQYDPRAENPYTRTANFETRGHYDEDDNVPIMPRDLVKPQPMVDPDNVLVERTRAEADRIDPDRMRERGRRDEGSAKLASTGREKEIRVGTTSGRRYPVGTQPPAFIHPSSEPLKASLMLSDEMKAEMRQLLNLTLSSLEPKFASAESKNADQKGLEGGLSYIGLELENMERKVARIWAAYDNVTEPTVNYPKKYSLKTTAEVQVEIESLDEIRDRIPSPTAQKEVTKQMVLTLLGSKVAADTIDKINSEIDKAQYMTSDAVSVQADVAAGLVDLVTASNARGYDGKKVVPLANNDHADRVARIATAQAEAAPAARGTADLAQNPGAKGQVEKQQSRDTTNEPTPAGKVRGPGVASATVSE